MNDDTSYRTGYQGPPALHQSLVSALLDKSPWHAWKQHPMLGGAGRAATKSMDNGTIAHALALGQSLDDIVRIDAPDYRKKAAQEARDAAHAAGKTPVLDKDFLRIIEASNAAVRKLRESGYVLSGESEKVLAWTKNGCPCRAKLDHVLTNPHTIIDLKFGDAGSAHPDEVDKHVGNFGYHTQAAAYSEGFEECGIGTMPFYRLIFSELTPPHIQTIARLSGERMQVGRSRWERAQKLWVRCLETDKWPDYGTTEHVSEAKPWEMAREMTS
jgi:hypothetical protein